MRHIRISRSGQDADCVSFVEETHAEKDLLAPFVLELHCGTVILGSDELQQLRVLVPLHTHLVPCPEFQLTALQHTPVCQPAIRNSQDVLLRALLVLALADADTNCQPGRGVSLDFDRDVDGVVEFRERGYSHHCG